MEKLIKYLSALDWFLGIGTILYGLIVGPLYIALFGALGLCVAWYKPAPRIKKYLESRVLAKAPSTKDTHAVLDAEKFYAEMLEGSATAAALPAKKNYSANVTFGPMFLGGSRHNILAPAHFNLYQPPGTQQFLR